MKWLAGTGPTEHSSFEHAAFRLGFAVIVFLGIPARLDFPTQDAPNGIAHLVDLTWMGAPAVWITLRWTATLALVLYALGRAKGPALATVASIYIAAQTLINSQGSIGHSCQLVALVLLVQTVVYLTLCGGARERAEDLAVHASRQAIAAGYVVAGLSKLRESGISWVADSPNVAVQIIKSTHQRHHEHLRFDEGAEQSLRTAEWILAHPHLTQIAFAGSLVLELGAVVCLFGRKCAALAGVTLIVFHQTTELAMGIAFLWHQLLILVFLVNVPYWAHRVATRGTDVTPS